MITNPKMLGASETMQHQETSDWCWNIQFSNFEWHHHSEFIEFLVSRFDDINIYILHFFAGHQGVRSFEAASNLTHQFQGKHFDRAHMTSQWQLQLFDCNDKNWMQFVPVVAKTPHHHDMQKGKYSGWIGCVFWRQFNVKKVLFGNTALTPPLPGQFSLHCAYKNCLSEQLFHVSQWQQSDWFQVENLPLKCLLLILPLLATIMTVSHMGALPQPHKGEALWDEKFLWEWKDEELHQGWWGGCSKVFIYSSRENQGPSCCHCGWIWTHGVAFSGFQPRHLPVHRTIPDHPRTPLELQLKNTQDPETRRILIQIYNKSISTEEGLMKLRQDLKRKKVVKLVYQDFVLPEPKFGSMEDREMFHTTQRNVTNLRYERNLSGLITYVPHTHCCKRGFGTIRYTAGGCKFYVVPGGNPKEETRDNGTLMCPLMVEGGWSFQHFTDTLMPKLIQVYNYIIPADVKIILPPPALADKVMILHILDKIGINRSQLVFYTKQSLSADGMLDTCVAPTIHPDIWNVMRSMLGVPDRFHHAIKKVKLMLLTRANSRHKGRNLLNQHNLVNFVHRKYGNNSLTLFTGGYSLSHAITLFSQSHIILGVHGGAFYNINFCLKGTHVIEILPADPPYAKRKNMFWEQATMLDLVYWRIYEKPKDDALNVDISLDKFGKILDKIDQQLRVEHWNEVEEM